MWTHFMDMHSGGGTKEAFEHCFIEAPEKEAEIIFYNRFGHNPNRVTCTCCGEDYSISESESLEQLTGYLRGCHWEEGGYVERASERASRPYRTLEEFLNGSDDILVIRASEISLQERIGDIPAQGYVWVE